MAACKTAILKIIKFKNNKNKGIPTSIAIQNRDNDDVPFKNLNAKWILEFNGQTIMEKENTVMFNVSVYKSGNLKLKPETLYNYTIYYYEIGRERSEYSGTFTTGTKQWLELHEFGVE